MIRPVKDSLHGAANMVGKALKASANDLQAVAPRRDASDRRRTLAIVAASCFLLGYLWAKAMAARA